MKTSQLALGSFLLLAPGLAYGQGANACASATPISGQGVWSVNTLSATTDGPTTGGCANGNAFNDVWFEWTATTTESMSVHLCNGTNFDSVIAIYDPGCPVGAALSCGDDYCGLQSRTFLSAVSGQSYLVRVGGWGAGTSGTGNLTIEPGSPPPECANPSTGADVVIGSLNGITDWGSVGSISAYSIGTTSCNFGDTNLNWISSSANHPVIGQNIYRFENGRFEQLGQSWLKHGFLALAEELCCNCTNPGSGSLLGVGCSDPYGSGLNGDQSGLGPKSQVNAFLGTYAYPFFAQGATGNAIYKRCQVVTDELSPSLHPTASYYGEGQYVAPDDAAAGNGFNNAAWVDINVGTFSGGSWNLSLSGETHTKDPAIRAWQEEDPSVTLTDAFVPGEGLFIVGSNAIDNNDGTWSYEYAVFNLNSDLSCGSFTVPLAPVTVVTDIGFHDVDSHSGEPYDNTDWPGASTPTDVSWETVPYATNPNANALRWGTLYNFRFVADASPTNGQVELGLFKPGGPASILVDAQVPSSGSDGEAVFEILCDPANDHFQGNYVKLDTSSFGTGIGSGVHIEATDGPISEFGFLLGSAGGAGFNPIYSGILCLQLPTGRYNGNIANNQGVPAMDSLGQFDATGLFQSITGNATSTGGSGFDLPLELPFTPMGQTISPGETWYFQLWYRDQIVMPGDSANFSNLLQVTFP